MQRATYSGHKRRNGIKFQSMSLPDGIIHHLFGPLESRRHDMTLFRDSQIESALQRSLMIDGRQFYIYGDSAYVLRPFLQIAFQGAALTEEQCQFNTEMNRLRTSVEWGFKDIKKYFTHVDFTRKNIISNTPVGLHYIIAGLLWNFRACLYSSQTSQFFDCKAPSLEEYLFAFV